MSDYIIETSSDIPLKWERGKSYVNGTYAGINYVKRKSYVISSDRAISTSILLKISGSEIRT